MRQDKVVDIGRVKALIDDFKVNTPFGLRPLSYKSRNHELVIGRAIIYNFLRKNNLPLVSISRLFNGDSVNTKTKDHATVIHGCKKYKTMCESPKQYPEFVRIKNELESLLDNCFANTYSEVESYKSVIETFTPIERMILNATEKAEFLHIQTLLFRKLNQSLSA